MALAKGRSVVRSGTITLHTKTAIHLAEMMTSVCPDKCSITCQLYSIFLTLIAGEVFNRKVGKQGQRGNKLDLM